MRKRALWLLGSLAGLLMVSVWMSCGTASTNRGGVVSVARPDFRTRPILMPLAGRPECPHDWDFKHGQFAVVSSIIDVPEFHDCQRFIVDSSGSLHYQALYAIFAAESLLFMDTLATAADSVSAVAEIYAEGTYTQLGIVSPYSCLYLYRDTSASSGWGARLVRVGSPEYDCRQRVNPNTLPGMLLEVKRTTIHLSIQTYPPVSRWDWDNTNKQQYIGIMCGEGWCEVGQPGFQPSPVPTISLSPSDKLNRTHMIKGWYDQQFLAARDANGNTVPTRILGTIYPDSGLNDYTIANDFKPGEWVPVAHVALEQPADPTTLERAAMADYESRLNFEPTVHDGPLNTIYMCRGPKGTAPGQCDVNAKACADGLWWAMIEDADPSDGTTKHYTCVVRRPHDALTFHVPGVARWRWLASDETTWKRCDAGCCELH